MLNCAGVAYADKEGAWIFVMDMIGALGKCIKRSVRIAKKSAKSRLSPEMAVRYTARIAIQSVRTKDVSP